MRFGSVAWRPGSPPPRASGGPPAVVGWALCGWIGLACGLAESVVQLAWRRVEFRLGSPDLWVNWQGPWMAPLSMALGFAGVGLVAGLARGVAPRFSNRIVPIVLVGLGAWSVLGEVPALNAWASGLLASAVGFRAGRLARFDSPGFRRLARASFPAMAGLWLLLLATTGVVPAVSEAWSMRSSTRPAQGSPNVVLVVLDTVRVDNLSLHGYGRPTSPRLVEWARRGVRFEQARSTSPYTLGTHASLFTGRRASETSARVNAPLDGRWPTIAEHLRDRGYATGGFVGNIFYGSARYGLDRGFLRYHDIPGAVTRRATPREFLRSSRLGDRLVTWLELKWRIFVPMQRLRLDGDEVNREALAWVDASRPTGRPFFLFANYFDAHSPYSLPAKAPLTYSRLSTDKLEVRMKRLEEAEERLGGTPSSSDVAEVERQRADVDSHVKDAYDDGIAWADRKLDELLRGLERRGLLEDTVVVVTADHGEMLGEHEVIGHGKSLHRQVVHVPLVVIDPRSIRGLDRPPVSTPVSLRDVPATILDLIGDPDAGRFPGRSLRRHWASSGPDSAEGRPVLSEMEHLSWRRHSPQTPAAYGPSWLLTEGRWSYHRQAHETLGTKEQLFDLEADPGELRDLAADPDHRGTLEALRGRFEAAGVADSGGEGFDLGGDRKGLGATSGGPREDREIAACRDDE